MILWVVCGSAFFRWMRRRTPAIFFRDFFMTMKEQRDNEENYRFFRFFHTNFFLFLSLGYCYADQFSISISLLELGHVRNGKIMPKLWAISILHLLKLYENCFFMIFLSEIFTWANFHWFFITRNSPELASTFCCVMLFYSTYYIRHTPDYVRYMRPEDASPHTAHKTTAIKSPRKEINLINNSTLSLHRISHERSDVASCTGRQWKSNWSRKVKRCVVFRCEWKSLSQPAAARREEERQTWSQTLKIYHRVLSEIHANLTWNSTLQFRRYSVAVINLISAESN